METKEKGGTVVTIDGVETREKDGIIACVVGGIEYVNGNIHPITMDCHGVAINFPVCGLVLTADAKETAAGEYKGVNLVKTAFGQLPATDEALLRIKAAFPQAIVIGSMVAATAYPGDILAMVDAPGYERSAGPEKRKSLNIFLTF